MTSFLATTYLPIRWHLFKPHLKEDLPKFMPYFVDYIFMSVSDNAPNAATN